MNPVEKIPNFDKTKALDVFDLIELMFEKRPDKRKKTEYSEWRQEINTWIEYCNTLCKLKVYEKQK